MRIHALEGGVSVLNDHVPVPGIGFLPVNAFVLRAREPVVVDTGLSLPGKPEEYMRRLAEVIDPADVRWIWLTHPDRDHTGALFRLLEAAPKARVVGMFATFGILSAEFEVPMDRVYLLNPGQSLDVGDRTLTAFRPPLYDSPATIGFYDDRTGVCFSSDCFGSPVASAELAGSGNVAEVASDDLLAGQLLWAGIDSPWVHQVDRAKYESTIEPLRVMDPSMILSTHLPPAVGRTGEFVDMLAAAPRTEPFVGPDQRALEEMLKTFEPA
ncbi:MAG TPA: MBL fold metallo-hydrolase [Candidatus Limnocylindrales bacterium]